MAADPFEMKIPELPAALMEKTCATCGRPKIYHVPKPKPRGGYRLECAADPEDLDHLDPRHPDTVRALRDALTVIDNVSRLWFPLFGGWYAQATAYMEDQAKAAVSARDEEIVAWSEADRLRRLAEASKAPAAVEVIAEDDLSENTNPGTPPPTMPPAPPSAPPPARTGARPPPPPPPVAAAGSAGRPVRPTLQMGGAPSVRPAPPAPPGGGNGVGNGKLPLPPPSSDDGEDDDLRRTHQMPAVRPPAPPQDQTAGDGCMNPRRNDTAKPCDRPVTRRHTFPKRGGGEVEIRCCADSECSSVLWRQFMNVLQPDDPAAMTKYPRDAFHAALQAP